MRKLSEVKNEDALELIAEVIEPLSTIIGDPQAKALRAKKAKTTEIMKWVLQNHSEEVLTILAALDGEDANEYEISAIQLPIRVLEILNDKELISLFSSQGQMTEKTSSGSAMENTEATER